MSGIIEEIVRQVVDVLRGEEPGPEAMGDPVFYGAWAKRHAGKVEAGAAPVSVVVIDPAHAAVANRDVKAAAHEQIIFIEAGDTLAPHAAGVLSAALHAAPGSVIYADHDVQTPAGLASPFLKPDFSPQRLLEQPYIGAPVAMSRALFFSVGRFRPQARGALLHDLVLRASEHAPVVHVSDILCHRSERVIDPIALRRVVSSALRRRNIGARLTPGRIAGTVRVRPTVPPRTRVSIVIPFRDRPELLDQCLGSLAERTRFSRYEVILVDNGSTDPRTADTVLRWKRELPARVLSIPGPFNFAELNNRAARVARGDQMLLLNNDTQVLDRDWLHALLEWSVRPDVGAVGPMLLHPDRTIQHAGLVLGMSGAVGHAFIGEPEDTPTGHGAAQVVRNVSAVTGACLMVGREKFWRAGGLDQDQFRVTFSDVALCLQLGRLGLRNLYTPHARLIHFEAKPVSVHEDRAFHERYREELEHDPYYHRWLSRHATDYRLAR